MDVDAALQTLSMSDRAVLLLRYDEGHDYRTIAEVTGLPSGTIASRLNRARERLRELLKSAYGPVEEAGRAAHLNLTEENHAESAELKASANVVNRKRA
jgi:hypothetical protein